ncbi:MAG: 5-aminolevulinate synthase [Actinomycetota bacterium]|nr:5-aminolevulinate synthase [Actinomycetota bacterium]
MGTSLPTGAVRGGHPALAAALDALEQRLDGLREEGRYRHFVELERPAPGAPYVRIADGSGRVVVDWCSNDYLGMSLHPAVVEAASRALAEHGVGSGGTRNIAGSHVLVRELEDELADLHAQEAALVFTSGFIANEASLRALGSLLEGCVVLSDERNHASMIDGIRASRAERAIFRHNDLEHLGELLEAMPRARPRIVAFESIYSMDGDIAPLGEICALAAEHGALTYVDETHAAGAYGHQGAGVAQALGAAADVTVIQGSLAKGYGTLGGFIAGPASVVDSVRSHASGFIFTTSLPPAIAAAALASVRHLRTSDAERAALGLSVRTLRAAFARAGVEAMPSQSHIVPVLIPGAERCREVAQRLLAEHSIYVQPINYPSVPRGGERLRIAPTPAHGPAHAEALASALAALLP